MNDDRKRELCTAFFNELAEALSDSYEVLKSCNNDISAYLCPKGTTDQVTYTSKPRKSFRVSDHWNWYASTFKCPDESYIQCFSPDMPRAKKRPEEGRASKPIFGVSVMMLGEDDKYHVIFGEKFDRRKQRWSFVTNTVNDVLSKGGCYGYEV